MNHKYIETFLFADGSVKEIMIEHPKSHYKFGWLSLAEKPEIPAHFNTTNDDNCPIYACIKRNFKQIYVRIPYPTYVVNQMRFNLYTLEKEPKKIYSFYIENGFINQKIGQNIANIIGDIWVDENHNTYYPMHGV